jgi:release factor glutamine methyltransferase
MLWQTKKVFFGKYIFDVWENVYEPAEDSFLFARNLLVQDNSVVLDMGTGCGILGIIAAVQASEVVAVDINPYAVRCAKENARLNRVLNKMVFLQGNLFTPIREKVKFDVILFNAPYLPSVQVDAENWLERAWSGGLNGRQIIDRFICEAPKHLKRNGCIFLMQSTLSNVDKTLEKFEEKSLRTEIVAKRSLPFFETLVLIRAIN